MGILIGGHGRLGAVDLLEQNAGGAYIDIGVSEKSKLSSPRKICSVNCRGSVEVDRASRPKPFPLQRAQGEKNTRRGYQLFPLPPAPQALDSQVTRRSN